MVASKEDEDYAYRRFAKACGDAWSLEGTKVAATIAKAAETRKAADLKSVPHVSAEKPAATRR